MSQSSQQLQHTWGQFASRQAAEVTKQKLETAGIPSQQITLETENQKIPKRIEDTQAIANAKSGAIAGGLLGAFIGLFLSLISAGFLQTGFAALNNFNDINILAPLLGAIVGAVGISLISALSGTNVPQSDKTASVSENPTDKMTEIYLVKVAGTPAEVTQAEEIIHKEGGKVGEEDRR